ncbi:glucose-6-phosphatase 3 [Hypomesus transpacificus]|uniref:glucose-6-phosphatase 3 n=1 Tax=Hypomesus transpacificus TaxID=137520 RepID=UPI001F078BE3|nr:glucose-6-phosphatase 3 [Hypomesus transpacificus]
MMDAIYTQGILMAETLQQKTKSQEKLWLIATHLGDPKAAFLLIFPLAYFLSKKTGAAIVWVAAITEWFNLIFKWMLFGERPFWWIGESHLYENNPPKVNQFASTCETGPGSPSGHAMVTAAVWWVMVSSLGSRLYSRTHSVLIAAVPYLFYLLLLVAVGLSRIFILAHFPHQVIVGSLTGLILGVILSRRVPEHRPLRFYVCCSLGLLIGTLLFHTALGQLGINLSWSISLAKKWCSHPEWIRLDTAPFSSLTRDCGAILGLGLAQHWKPEGWTLPWAPRALCLALSSMALYHVNRLPLPIQPQPLFYGLFFLKFIIVPQVVMVFIPGLVQLLTAKKKKD